jgi:flagellin-specific chaperone FliS
MNPKHKFISAYQAQPTKWTRVDLLIALYRQTVSSLRRLAEAIEMQDTVVLPHQTRSVFLLEQIVEGIDPERCEYAHRITSLCEYALNSLQCKDVDAIKSAAAALAEIQDGFQHIRSDAVALEGNGTIPPLDSVVELDG